MKKHTLLRLALPLLLLGAVACSNQMSTSLGSGIINDVDSTIVPVGSNIQEKTDSIPVDSAFSMRDVNDSIPSGLLRNPSSLIVGKFSGLASGANEEIHGYLEFKTATLRTSSYSSIRSKLRTAFRAGRVDSMVLHLDRVHITSTQGTVSSASIRARSCAILKDSTMLDRSKIYALSDTTIDTSFNVSTDSAALDTSYVIRLDTSYMGRIKRAVRDSALDTSAFSFCLSPGSSTLPGIVRFNNVGSDSLQPRVVIYYRTDSTTKTTATLYRNHASYSVFEGDSSGACATAISSWASSRRAVIKLDLSQLQTFMDTAAPSGERFRVIQKADLSLHIKTKSTDVTEDSIPISFSVFDSAAQTKTEFTKTTSFYVKANTDTTYILPLASYLQQIMVTSNKPSTASRTTAFLYLSIRTPNVTSPPVTQIVWNANATSKLKLKAIVTNPRSVPRSE